MPENNKRMRPLDQIILAVCALNSLGVLTLAIGSIARFGIGG